MSDIRNNHENKTEQNIIKKIFKIILPSIILLGLYTLIIFYIFLPLLRQVYIHEKKEMIKRLVDVVVGEIEAKEKEINEKHLVLETEQKKILERIQSLRFGEEKKDYFWVVGAKGQILMHPYIKDIVNVDPKTIKGPDGKILEILLSKMTSTVKKSNSGFIEYEWQYKDNPTILSKKLSYVYGIKSWNWILGVGVYSEDIDNEIVLWRTRLLLIGLFLAMITLTLYFIMFYQNEKTHTRELNALKKLKEQEDIFRQIFEETTDPTLILDDKNTFINCNDSAINILGFQEKSDLIGLTPYDISPKYQFEMLDTKTYGAQKIAEAIEKGHARFEWIHHTSSGAILPVDINMTKIVLQDRFILYVVWRDITQQKHIQEALKENEHRFRTTLFAIGDVVISTDLRGNIRQMNPAAEQLLNCELKEVYNKNLSKVFNIYDENENSLLNEDMSSAEILNTIDKVRDVILINNQEKKYQLSLSANIIKSDNLQNEGLVLVGRDVTKEFELVQEIEKREKLFRTIFETSPFAISINKLANGAFLTSNPAFSLLTGYSEDELLNSNIGINIFFKKQNNIIQLLKELKETERLRNIQSTLVKKTGEEIDIYFSSAIIEYNNEPCILTICVDLTEVKRLEDQLRQAQKMDVIGQLAGGIAHDFNNMLGGILGFAELLDIYLLKDPKVKEYTQAIIEGSKRAAELTQKLLVFSRKAKTTKEAFDIHDSIKSAIALLKRTIDPRITIKTSLHANPSIILGDISLIQNAFLNLSVNARDAMPNGGELSFTSRNVYLDEISCQYHYKQLKSGEYIEVQISDTGVGISKDYIEKIFEPFFTTKPVGKGTGLGLSAVFGTVQQHQGFINVHSELSSGTIFKILIPLHSGNNESLRNIKEENLIKGKGCILIVEDEALIRNMAKEVLESLGYDVLTAEDGEEGLDVYTRNKSRINLILLDIIMPKLSGKDFVFAIDHENQNLKIILTSGFNQEIGLESLLKKNNINFIQKPYRIAVLSQMIHDMLETN